MCKCSHRTTTPELSWPSFAIRSEGQRHALFSILRESRPALESARTLPSDPTGPVPRDPNCQKALKAFRPTRLLAQVGRSRFAFSSVRSATLRQRGRPNTCARLSSRLKDLCPRGAKRMSGINHDIEISRLLTTRQAIVCATPAAHDGTRVPFGHFTGPRDESGQVMSDGEHGRYYRY